MACGIQQQKNLTLRTSLTGLSDLLRNAYVIIYSRGVLQPSGIRRFGIGVIQLSPLTIHFGDIFMMRCTGQESLRRSKQPVPLEIWH